MTPATVTLSNPESSKVRATSLLVSRLSLRRLTPLKSPNAKCTAAAAIAIAISVPTTIPRKNRMMCLPFPRSYRTGAVRQEPLWRKDGGMRRTGPAYSTEISAKRPPLFFTFLGEPMTRMSPMPETLASTASLA